MVYGDNVVYLLKNLKLGREEYLLFIIEAKSLVMLTQLNEFKKISCFIVSIMLATDFFIYMMSWQLKMANICIFQNYSGRGLLCK